MNRNKRMYIKHALSLIENNQQKTTPTTSDDDTVVLMFGCPRQVGKKVAVAINTKDQALSALLQTDLLNIKQQAKDNDAYPAARQLAAHVFPGSMAGDTSRYNLAMSLTSFIEKHPLVDTNTSGIFITANKKLLDALKFHANLRDMKIQLLNMKNSLLNPPTDQQQQNFITNTRAELTNLTAMLKPEILPTNISSFATVPDLLGAIQDIEGSLNNNALYKAAGGKPQRKPKVKEGDKIPTCKGLRTVRKNDAGVLCVSIDKRMVPVKEARKK